jgi:hypothetical protein
MARATCASCFENHEADRCHHLDLGQLCVYGSDRTGWFAADAANVKPGSTVAEVSDGAVGSMRDPYT